MNSKWFTLQELCYSRTAEQLGISNEPDDTQRSNLFELMEVLDGIREYINKPIIVSSGFRSTELNKRVGGVKTSAHCIGYAADLQCGRDIDNFYTQVCEYLKQNNIKFDQCIIEKKGKTKWVHFGLKNLSGLQRCQFLSLDV